VRAHNLYRLLASDSAPSLTHAIHQSIRYIATTTTTITTHNQTRSFPLLSDYLPLFHLPICDRAEHGKARLKILYMIKSNTFNLWFSFGV